MRHGQVRGGGLEGLSEGVLKANSELGSPPVLDPSRVEEWVFKFHRMTRVPLGFHGF